MEDGGGCPCSGTGWPSVRWWGAVAFFGIPWFSWAFFSPLFLVCWFFSLPFLFSFESSLYLSPRVFSLLPFPFSPANPPAGERASGRVVLSRWPGLKRNNLSARVTYRGRESSSCLLRQGAGIPCSPAGCTKASAVRLLLEPLPKLFGGAEAFLAPSVEVNLHHWREGGGSEESARQAVCKEDGRRGQQAAGDGGCTRTLSPSWPPCPACALPSL